ncbi:hypothetical protein ACEWY4_027574 [Coilia grayii]|uniref:KASH5-like coiled-coil domain-containing protein n=1 Tax=Coilia grayii TaxID=363190 RepID=A0ABD1IS99_9TELE
MEKCCPLVALLEIKQGIGKVVSSLAHDEEEAGSREGVGPTKAELLDVTFEACDVMATGRVCGSDVLRFVRSVIGPSSGQEELLLLQSMLGTQGAGLTLDRPTFHSIMNTWIQYCREGSSHSIADSTPETPPGADVTSPSEHQTDNSCEVQLQEVKYVCEKLQNQNAELRRAVAHGDELNLQLTMETAELRSQLARAQLACVRVRPLVDELEEVYEALSESQQQHRLSQDTHSSLVAEHETLKIQLNAMKEKRERWSLERSLLEDQLNHLKKANAHITGLQAELLRLQEQSRKTLLR